MLASADHPVNASHPDLTRRRRLERAPDRQIWAPRLATARGRRKLADGMRPSAPRGPVITAGSTLVRSASLQLALMFHELPLPVDEPSATAVALPTARSAVSAERDES